MALAVHRKEAASRVRCFVLTISDTRTEATDTSGNAIVEALTAAGHEIAGHTIVRDDPAAVRTAVTAQAASSEAVITTGGTGIAGRDTTYEAIASLLDK